MVMYTAPMNTPTFHEKLEQERPRIVRLCTYWLGDATHAEDAAQEVLIEAWRHSEQLRDPHAFRGWLSGIAQNVCARRRRKQGREVARLTNLPDETSESELRFNEADLTVELERGELVTLLDRALALLPQEARGILIQKYLEEQPNEAIADYLGLTPNATAVRLHRGKMALRKVLITHFAEESVTLGWEKPDGGQQTNIWCPTCGHQRLMGKWDAQEFVLRCPTCHAEPNLYHAQSGPSSIFDGVKGFRPALTRFTTWMDGYLRGAIPQGVVLCRRCRRLTPLRKGFPPYAHPSLHDQRGLHVYCSHCEAGSYETLDDLALGLSQGLVFFRANPRIHVLPQLEINHEGVEALVVRYTSVTSNAMYEVVVREDTYEVLKVLERRDE